jgi:hypothetical protein
MPFANVLILNKLFFKPLGINELRASRQARLRRAITRPPLPKDTNFFPQFQIFRVTICPIEHDDLSGPNVLITNNL